MKTAVIFQKKWVHNIYQTIILELEEMDTMIIVYVSIGLFVLSLIYLGYTIFKAMKEMKPNLQRVQETTTRIQRKADMISGEMNKLAQTQREIQVDIEQKKRMVSEVVESAKQTPQLVKEIWNQGKKVPHPHGLKGKPSSELGKFSERLLALLEKKYKVKTLK